MECSYCILCSSYVIVRYCDESMVLAGCVKCLYLPILLVAQMEDILHM
jgi:hypothetical protein